MAKGNTNIFLNNQNVADANVAGSIVRLTDGSVKLKAGLPSGITNKEIRLALNFRNAFKQGDAAGAINSFFSSVQAQFKSIRYASDNILFWVVRKKYSYREITQYSDSGSAFASGYLGRLFPSQSRNVSQWWNQGASGLMNNPLTQIASSTLDISTTMDFSDGTDLKNYFNVTSDSIGVVANTKYLQLDTTLPLIDITQERYGVPIPFSASSENKISPTTRNIMYNLSKFNTALMRRNLIPVAYGNTTVIANLAVDATLPHGLNLINDLPTFVKLNTSIMTLIGGLKSAIRDIRVFRYISYLSNIGNKAGFNYRDNRPSTGADKDFVVLSGEEQAAGITEEINSLAAISQAQAAVQKAAQSDIINSFFQGRGSQIITPSGGVVRSNIESGELIIEPDEVPALPGLPPAEFIDEVPPGTEENTFNATGEQIRLDWDGSPNAEILSGWAGQSGTSYILQGGASLNGERDLFIVAPTTDANGRGIPELQAKYPLGSVVYVTNNVTGKTVRAIIGDNGAAYRGWGELSGKLAESLGIDIVTKSDGRKVTGNSKNYNISIQLDTSQNVGPRGSQTIDSINTFLNNTPSAPAPVRQVNTTGINQVAQGIINSRGASTPTSVAPTKVSNGQTVVDIDALMNEGFSGTAPAEQPATAPVVSTQYYNKQGVPIIEVDLPTESGIPNGGSTLAADILDTPDLTNNDAFAPTPLTLTSTPSSTTQQQNTGTVTVPGFNNTQNTQNQQAQSDQTFISEMTSLLDSIGSGKYSNRQKSDRYTFFINVEGAYQEVDYLLKRLSTGLNPCKSIIQRLSTAATTALSNSIDTSSPATAASQLSLLGIPSQFADLGGEVIKLAFANKNSNTAITDAISDQFTNFTDPLLENPWVGAYDSVVGGFNELGGLIGGDSAVGGLLPTSSELFDALDPGLFLEELKIPSILPSVDLGSIKDLLSLAASVATSGPPTSLTGLIKMQEQLYSIICNFELPDITFPALEALLKMNFKELEQKIKEMVTRFIERILDQFNILKILKNLKKTFKELLEEIKQKIIEQLFSCEKYKKADKSGKPSAGG